MKSQATISFLVLTLLINGIALAGQPLLDEHLLGSDLSQQSPIKTDHCPNSSGHSDSTDHCCHLQAHFQTVLYQYDIALADSRSVSERPHFSEYLNSYNHSPPTPPPKA